MTSPPSPLCGRPTGRSARRHDATFLADQLMNSSPLTATISVDVADGKAIIADPPSGNHEVPLSRKARGERPGRIKRPRPPLQGGLLCGTKRLDGSCDRSKQTNDFGQSG